MTMNQNNPTTTSALQILGFAALTLSVRVLTWLALLGGMALFAYAVLYPDLQRTGAACGYALLVFLPALWSEKKQNRTAAARTAAIQQPNPWPNGGPIEERQYE
jgi:hypothetical protein